MQKQTFSIYVGMALTDAPEEFRTVFHDELKSKLREIPNVEVLDFYWISNSPTGGDDIEVYNLDEQHSQNADLLVAIVDHPSIGLGMEIMLRHATGKPSLFFANKDKRVTRMLTGYLKKNQMNLHRYDNVDEILRVVKDFIS